MAQLQRKQKKTTAPSPATLPPAAPRRVPVGLIWTVALCLFLCCVPLIYASMACHCDNSDAFVYGQHARDVLSGKKLYTEVWNTKPPLGILIYGVPQLFGANSYAALQVFGGVCLVIQCLLFWRVFRVNRLAVACCVIFTTLYPLTGWDFLWPSTEHFANLFVTPTLLIAYIMFRDGRVNLWHCAVAGALACFAFQVRQTALFSSVVPLAGILLVKETWQGKGRAVAAWLGGCAAAWILILILVFFVSDARSYFHAVIQGPRAFAGIASWAQVRMLAWGAFQTTLAVFIALFAMLSFVSPYRPLVLLALGGALAACFSPLQSHVHFWVALFPVIALFIGIPLVRYGGRIESPHWVCLTVLCVYLLPQVPFRIHYALEEPTNDVAVRVAAAADRAAPEHATLLARGPWPLSEAIQFASKLPPNNTCWVSFELNPPFVDTLPKSVDAIFDEVVANPPGVLAIHRDYLSAIQNSKNLANDLRLVQLLIQRHTYVQAGAESDFVIATIQSKEEKTSSGNPSLPTPEPPATSH
jgi:hypothetical protein